MRHTVATGAALLFVVPVAILASRETASAPAAAPSSAHPTTSRAPQPTTSAPRPTPPPAPTSRAPARRSQAGTDTAAGLLATLAVKGRAPKTGYDRARFGSAWTDDNDTSLGHNGCDTRNDILARDLTDVTVKLDTHGCVALRGTLHDPYTSRTIGFIRGQRTSSEVQIDHVVALSDAWQKGAQQLPPQDRIDFANDPLELLAVDGPTNKAKGDGDAATWLPPNKAYRCEYVAHQVAVKARYHLWVTLAERDAIARVLAGCPGQLAPTERDVPVVAARHVATRAPTTPTITTPPNVEYANCTAVRAAGAAPLYRGQPGYASHLDRDGDGVACES